jgi:hypothetical protein
VGGCLLVPDVDDAQTFDAATFVDGHDVTAAEREDDIDSLRRNRLRHEPPTLHALGHDRDSREPP